GESTFRLIKCELVFLGVDGADQLVLLHFELGLSNVETGLEESNIVLRPLHGSIGLRFQNVLLGLMQFRATLLKHIMLLGGIEFDDDIALPHDCARVEKMGDLQRGTGYGWSAEGDRIF